MALSATFKADFTSFYDAVEKAEIALKDFGGGAEKAGQKLNDMAQRFSGQKIVQEASLMVKAIGGIEGISKLTEKEIERLGNTTNEAVEKLKKLGKDVPKDLQAVADATKKADKASIDWMGSLTTLAGAIGVAFSVDAVLGFVGGLFETASAIKDMSAQWGVSTKAVQQWTAAAKGSGVEAKTVGNSVQFMTAQMAEGSDKYKISLEQLGLSYEKLRKLPLEEQYRQVIEAIRGVEDGTMQLDVAIGLLGPNAKQLMGAIRDGFIDAADKQKYMADETIKRLTDAQAKWKSYYEAVTIYSADAMSAAMGSFERLTKSWGSFFSYAKLAIGLQTRLPNLIKAGTAEVIALEGKTDSLVDQMLDLGHATTGTNKPLKSQAQIDAELAEKKARATKAASDAERAQEKLKRETEALTKKLEAEDEKVNDLIDSFGGSGGKGAIGKAEQYLKAISMAIPIEQMSAVAKLDIHKAMDAAIVSYQAAGEMAPKVMYDIWLATKNTTEGVVEFSSKWKNFTDLVKKPLDIDLGPGFKLSDKPDLTPIEKYGTALGRISLAMGEIGRMSGGTFGDIAEAIGGVAGGLDAGARAAEDFDKAMREFKPGGSTAKGIADVAAAGVVAAASFMQMTEGASVLQSTLTGAAMGAGLAPGPYMAYGAAIGAVVGYIRGINNASGDTVSALNKMKFHIADAAGGWDALGEAARKAGTSIFDVMNAQTPQDLQYATEKLGAALEYQATALDKVKEAAERYGITIEMLGPAMQRQELDTQAQQLFHDYEILHKAGIEQIAITDRMGDAVSIYVQDAKRMGQEVPIAMKPMLEQFAKSGDLLDENGDAITNLEDSGISFAMTMSDGFKAMIEEVKKLTDAIARGLGLAIEEIPQPVIRGRVEWESGATPDNVPRPNNRPGGGSAPEYARGTDGFVNFGRGTPVILHGWEAVVPRGDAASMATVTAGAGGGGGAVAASPIIINAQGAFFDTPGDLQRLASKVEDALNAKHGLTHRRRAS
jgi:hypothetical protein